jgi:hypothetical protein
MESLCPESVDEFFEDPREIREVTLTTILTGAFFLRVVNYPVVVEMYDKVKAGRKRVAYYKEFTDAERKVVSRWHTRFRNWHLVSGTPDRIAIKPATLALLQRAVNFFGSL